MTGERDRGRRVGPSPDQRRSARAAVEDPAVVLAAAARFLETRARSVDEVRRRLVVAGYRRELVDDAIGRLLDVGILDDAAFARAWVESRDRARPRGTRALRLELRRKGIAEPIVDQVLGARDGREATDPDEPPAPGGLPAFGQLRAVPVSGADVRGENVEVAAARRVLARHAASLQRVPDARRRRGRAYALLARNGFDPGVIGDALRGWSEDATGWLTDPGFADERGDGEP